MFGSHLSIAGGLERALDEAQRLGMACVQIFTKNQRQWRVPPLRPEQVEQWEVRRRATGIDQVVSHDSYLINLASPGGPTRQRSLDLFRVELERCEALGIAWLVIHPGSHLGEGEEAGLQRIVEALDQVHRELPGYRTITCLENTAGQGTALGCDLGHLQALLERAREPERLAVCLDTAHALAAGYNLSSAAGARRFLREVEGCLGLERVLVWHLNDSKAPRASRVDRHEHIGRGHVALEAFEVIVNHRRVRGRPKVLETPKGPGPGGEPWDLVNLRVLEGLVTPLGRSRGRAVGRR